MEDVLKESNLSEGTCAPVNRLGLIIGSIGVGALLMYMFDPERGQGRRSRLSDQLTSKANRLGKAAGSKAQDLRNRAQGVMHEVGLVGGARDRNTRDRSTNEDRTYQPVEQGV
jgi:hypothetical protein